MAMSMVDPFVTYIIFSSQCERSTVICFQGISVLKVESASWALPLLESEKFRFLGLHKGVVFQSTGVQISTSSTVFAVFLLSVCCQADWLDRSVSECGRHVALVSSRAGSSKPHSPRQSPDEAAFSYLSLYSRSILHTAGSTSAYPGHSPRRSLLRPSSLAVHWLEPTCLIDHKQE